MKICAPLLAAIILAGASSCTRQNEDWKAAAQKRIENIRMGEFTIPVTATAGETVAVELERHHFLFGTALKENLLYADTEDAKKYREFLLDNFNSAVAENGMKWYATEKKQGTITNEDGDAVVRFCKENNLPLRGHCLFWSRDKFVQDWVKNLEGDALQQAVDTRLEQVTEAFSPAVTCWDVNNEMLDGNFYESRIPGIRAHMFKRAAELSPNTPLFINEYGIPGNDEKLPRYRELAKNLIAAGAPVHGYGLQEHACERFATAGFAPGTEETRPERLHGWIPLTPERFMQDMDTLTEDGFPIHLTEVSSNHPDPMIRANGLETLIVLAFSHHNVETVLLWGFWARAHWLGGDAALVDKDWNITEAGKRVRHLWKERWHTAETPTVSADGNVTFRGYYGTYRVGNGDQATYWLCAPNAEPKQVQSP